MTISLWTPKLWPVRLRCRTYCKDNREGHLYAGLITSRQNGNATKETTAPAVVHNRKLP